MHRAVTALGSVLLCAAVVPAAELKKIDRTIRKEPAYGSEPKYCLVVFGRRAETRIWLVVDDKTLYVDRNGNGDLTEPGEKIAGEKDEYDRLQFRAGEIVEADGKTKHSELVVGESTSRLFKRQVHYLSIKGAEGEVTQGAGDQGFGFAKTMREAPIVHLNGPMTMRVQRVVAGKPESWRTLDYPYELRAGESVINVHLEIGTPGLGKGTFAVIPVEAVPEELYPTLEMIAPSSSDPKKTIKVEFTLKDRC
jgi:hypothetical protein